MKRSELKRLLRIVPVLTGIFCFYLSKVYAVKIDIFDKIIYENKSENLGNGGLSTTLVVIFTIFLAIYWIVLLVIFEREDKYEGTNYLKDEEIFQKYNPLLAGCISQNRDVLSRDIIAVIINLSNKGIVKLDILKDAETKNGYKYMLYRIKDKEYLMDDVEKEIHSIIFEFVQKESEEVDLVQKLKDMPKIEETYKKFNGLNYIAKAELNKHGANRQSVPMAFRIYNIFMFMVAIVLCIYNINEACLDIKITVSTVLWCFLIIALMLMSIPLIIALCYLVLKVIGYTKKGINKINELKLNGQKIVSTSVSIILSTIILNIVTALVTHNIYLVLDEILLSISYLVMRTDNLMLKNDTKILSEYASVRALEEKLENYTTLSEKNIEQIVLWKEYIAYAISFGISTDIINYLDGLKKEDKLIQELKNYDLLYYSCKNYLEVFFGFNFNNKKKSEKFDFWEVRRAIKDKANYDKIESEMRENNWLDDWKHRW